MHRRHNYGISDGAPLAALVILFSAIGIAGAMVAVIVKIAGALL